MAHKGRLRLRKLRDELVRVHPSVVDPDATIRRGEVVVDGRINSNPGSLVRAGASIVLQVDVPLRGEVKLNAALLAFEIDAQDCIALDIGAAAGGFTRALLDAGARRIYAVDVGHGQLLGSLRQAERVTNLEATNLSELTVALVPDVIDLVTLDLSYLALSAAIRELERIRLADSVRAIALVKPQFELGLP